jgi:uncharacterized membrane protein YedE/YeeE
MFDSPGKLTLGFITGIFFGFLLQRGRVAKYHVILGQLLLKDWTVLKIMTTAIVVGAVGVYALTAAGSASLHVKPFLLGGVLIGAVAFGAGMAILGYCPGTSVAACGEGRRDAMVGVLGMLAGAGVFVAAYPWLEPVIKGLGSLGEMTFPQLLGVQPWVVILVLAVLVGGMFWFLERLEHRRTPTLTPDNRSGAGGADGSAPRRLSRDKVAGRIS